MEFDYIAAMYSDVTLGHTWLTQMGRAAEKYGVTIQYCMSPSRAALQSLSIPVVTQVFHPCYHSISGCRKIIEFNVDNF